MTGPTISISRASILFPAFLHEAKSFLQPGSRLRQTQQFNLHDLTEMTEELEVTFELQGQSNHFAGDSYCLSSAKADDSVICQTLLSMRPLFIGKVNGMTAQDHVLHLWQVLHSYGKSDENVVCLVDNNCNVNQQMAHILRVPLIGCGSHKLNLAIKKWISNQPQFGIIIQKVAGVMKKASTLKVSAELRKLTTLHVVRENDSRWSSTFEMVAQFFRIQAELSAVLDLLPLLPSLLECDFLRKAFVNFKHLNQVTAMLQKWGITFVHA
jgi:hypothetical protein